jgi:DNA-directed RNA polymerase subunit F
MILDRKPISLAEVKEILEGVPDNEKKTQMEAFLKHFLKIKPEKSKKIKEDIEKLDLLKIKDANIVKIADIVPEDASDLNKIFSDVSLTEDETKKILDIVKDNK